MEERGFEKKTWNEANNDIIIISIWEFSHESGKTRRSEGVCRRRGRATRKNLKFILPLKFRNNVSLVRCYKKLICSLSMRWLVGFCVKASSVGPASPSVDIILTLKCTKFRSPFILPTGSSILLCIIKSTTTTKIRIHCLRFFFCSPSRRNFRPGSSLTLEDD